MNLFDSPSNSLEKNEETRAPLSSTSGGISSSADERNFDFKNRSSSSSPSPCSSSHPRPRPDEDGDEYCNRNQLDNDLSPSTTLVANCEDANYTDTYTGAFPPSHEEPISNPHDHRNFVLQQQQDDDDDDDERQQDELQRQIKDDKRNQFEQEGIDYNNAESKSNLNAEKISHSKHYDISPLPASQGGRTTDTRPSNHDSHNRHNANGNDNDNGNGNGNGNTSSSVQTSNQWIHHHMEEATRMTRDVEHCLEELNRIQVQNAIVMDHLVMAGADLHA